MFQSGKVLCTLCCPREGTSRCSSLRSYQMLTLCLSSVKLQVLLWSKSVTLGQCILQGGALFLCLKPIIMPTKTAHFDLLNGLKREFPCLNWTSEARMLLLVQTTRLSSHHPFTHASMQGLRPGAASHCVESFANVSTATSWQDARRWYRWRNWTSAEYFVCLKFLVFVETKKDKIWR